MLERPALLAQGPLAVEERVLLARQGVTPVVEFPARGGVGPEERVRRRLGSGERALGGEREPECAGPLVEGRARPCHRVAFTGATVDAVLELGEGVAALVAEASLGLAELDLLERAGTEGISEEDADASDRRQMTIGLVQAGVNVLLAVLFLVWMHRANKNAHQFKPRMDFTPGWCVGWWFIPIMNLFKPVQAMAEIWTVSRGSRKSPGLAVVGVWWALWLVRGGVGQLSLRLSQKAEELDELQRASQVTLAGDFLEIPTALLALVVVRTVHRLQETHPRIEAVDPEVFA